MGTIFVIAVLAVSSLAAAALLRWMAGATANRLPGVARRTLEFVALWLLCLVLNVGLGTIGVLAFRALTARFVSVYIVNDDSFVIFSALQAFILHAWLTTRLRDVG